MCIFSMPEKTTRAPLAVEPQHRPHDAPDRPTILRNDVVQIRRSRKGALSIVFGGAAVCGRYVPRSCQWESTCGCDIALGAEKVDHMTTTDNGPVQLLLLPGNLHAGLVHTPAVADRPLALTKHGGKHRQNLDCPARHRAVIHKHTAFAHHHLDVTQAQGYAAYQRKQVSITSGR